MTDAATRARDAEVRAILVEHIADVITNARCGDDAVALVRSLAADAARWDALAALGAHWVAHNHLTDGGMLLHQSRTANVLHRDTWPDPRSAIDAYLAAANARALADAFPVPTPDAGVADA